MSVGFCLSLRAGSLNKRIAFIAAAKKSGGKNRERPKTEFHKKIKILLNQFCISVCFY